MTEFRHVASLDDRSQSAASLCFRPDGGMLACSTPDPSIFVWDIETLQPVMTLATHATVGPRTLAFSPDGQHLACAGDDHSIRLWDLAAGTSRLVAQRPNRVLAVAFHAEGRLLASGEVQDARVHIWDVATAAAREASTLEAGPWVKDVAAVAFSHAKGYVAAGGADNGMLCRWFTGSPEPFWRVQAHDEWVAAVSFSPDDQLLVSAGDDGMVRVWETWSGLLLHTFTGHYRDGKRFQPFLYAVAFAPDGQVLASGGADGTVRLWEVGTGRELQVLALDDEVRALAFSPDGALLVTGCARRAVQVWRRG
jgi:WD40 repeat protein